MERAFRAAADETEVPRDLLVAIAFVESRLDGRAGEADERGHTGLMGLREDDTLEAGPTLDEAATLLGVSPEDVQDEPALQVRGAGEILRAYAVEDFGEPPEALQDWWPVVERYSGSGPPRRRRVRERRVPHDRDGLRAPHARGRARRDRRPVRAGPHLDAR
jgi:hypothetical protein